MLNFDFQIGGSSVSFLEPTIRDEFNSMVEDFAKEVFGQ